jgi:deoxyribonuclease IV
VAHARTGLVQVQTSSEAVPVYPSAMEHRAPGTGAKARRIGMHTSIAGGPAQALELASRLRCTAMQIFSASPRMWTDGRQTISIEEADRFRLRRRELGIGPLVIHANYLINLAAPEGRLRERTLRGFRGELERAIALDAEFLVVHPGSRGESTIDKAIERIARALRSASKSLELPRLRILVEITAGQGTVVGWRLEELREILDACPEIPLGVCLDTAHLFAAGYEIHTEAGLDRTIRNIESSVGLGRVFVIHTNDSKAAFGSRVDRHEHLGRGQIGLDALRRIVNHPALAGRAFILETPIDRPGDDWRNVRALWRLAGVEWKRPAGRGDGMRKQRRAKAPAGKRRG